MREEDTEFNLALKIVQAVTILIILAIIVVFGYGLVYGTVWMLHAAFHFQMLSHYQVCAIWVTLMVIGCFCRSSSSKD